MINKNLVKIIIFGVDSIRFNLFYSSQRQFIVTESSYYSDYFPQEASAANLRMNKLPFAQKRPFGLGGVVVVLTY